MLENKFQLLVVRELRKRFPGCKIMKNDANQIQGLPDLLILYKNTWACLECKRSNTASIRPNQEYYVEELNNMSFASFICPENMEEVLDALQYALSSRRTARISKR